jgi:hypothetical protein
MEQIKQSIEATRLLPRELPKITQEVKSSDELLDVMKYNYNDSRSAAFLTVLKHWCRNIKNC